jgi:hypothetical protein
MTHTVWYHFGSDIVLYSFQSPCCSRIQQSPLVSPSSGLPPQIIGTPLWRNPTDPIVGDGKFATVSHFRFGLTRSIISKVDDSDTSLFPRPTSSLLRPLKKKVMLLRYIVCMLVLFYTPFTWSVLQLRSPLIQLIDPSSMLGHVKNSSHNLLSVSKVNQLQSSLVWHFFKQSTLCSTIVATSRLPRHWPVMSHCGTCCSHWTCPDRQSLQSMTLSSMQFFKCIHAPESWK